ncbi:MAG: NUDIX hydrolase [Chloroflexi bacterium]|nr:NUDIX hydrolase [Chloroflexota bacterium]
MKSKVIRALAICVFRNGDKILVGAGFDSVKQQTFYRPLGGSIEFGETSADTITRELKEELDAQVCDLKFLGTLENIFTFEGERGHEIVLVYDGKFVDASLYARKELKGFEKDDAHSPHFRAVWKTLSEFDPIHAPVYPNGLVELLSNHQS